MGFRKLASNINTCDISRGNWDAYGMENDPFLALLNGRLAELEAAERLARYQGMTAAEAASRIDYLCSEILRCERDDALWDELSRLCSHTHEEGLDLLDRAT